MVLIEEAFRKGDVYLDYPFEDVQFRWEKQTRKVLRHGRKVERRRAL